jgi:hypothetical protein
LFVVAQVYPEVGGTGIPPDSFFTCGSDKTVRIWNTGPDESLVECKVELRNTSIIHV